MGVYAANGQPYSLTLDFMMCQDLCVHAALLLSWPAENVSPQTKRATATAMQIFIGDIGGARLALLHPLFAH
jgi:hypothetical protein